MRIAQPFALAFVLFLQAGCQQQPAEIPMSLKVAAQESAWDTPGGEGVQIDTPNYRIFSTSSNRRFRTLLPGFMEASYRNYLQLTNLPNRPLGEPLPMYMMGSREEWAALTKAVVKHNAELYLGIENGGYCYKNVCVFWQMPGLGTLQIAAHEGMHQFLHHRMADQLPMWLEEGLCTQAEGYNIQGESVSFGQRFNFSRMGDLERTITNSAWVPSNKLLPMDAGDALGGAVGGTGYYGQLWAMVQFIRSDPVYRRGLERMIADAEAGLFHEALDLPPAALAELRLRGRIYNQTVSEKLFRHYITDDLATFEKRYRAFALKLTGLDGAEINRGWLR